MQTSIELPFADGVYTFRLGLAQIDELQRKCGAGIGAIYSRVLKGRVALSGSETLGDPSFSDFHLADVLETIRLGLIGGNSGLVNEQSAQVTPARATQLIDAYVKDQPLKAAWDMASAILFALMEGYEDKKKDPPAPVAETAKATSTMRRRSRTAR